MGVKRSQRIEYIGVRLDAGRVDTFKEDRWHTSVEKSSKVSNELHQLQLDMNFLSSDSGRAKVLL
jgi:hypothetical protein